MDTATVLAETKEQIRNEAAKHIEQGDGRAFALLEAYNRLRAEGIDLPELRTHHLRWGFDIEVTDPSQWKGIHKAIGKLRVVDKQPITDSKGRPTQRVRLILSPADAPLLNWYLKVTVERRLSKKDKCKVRVVTEKRVQVVCEVNRQGS